MERYLLACISGIVCVRLALAEYDQNTAIEYAKLASAAYCSNKSLELWNCPHCTADVKNVKVCHNPKDMTQAFVGHWDGECVISFEGTESYSSMWTDLEIYTLNQSRVWEGCENCMVHQGYYDTWKQLEPCILSNLKAIGCIKKPNWYGAVSKLRITGHSMGAAVSAIAMMALESDGWVISESYNFGMPRTGNWDFAKDLMDKFGGRMWRVTHHKDIIVQVPPPMWNYTWAYEHTGFEVFYNGTVSHGYKICEAPEDMNCSRQYWDVLLDDWSMRNHLHYMGIAMGIGGCGEGQQTLLV